MGERRGEKTCNIKQNINANIIKDAKVNDERTAKRGRGVEQEDSGDTTKGKKQTN